jgi:hypothetical protein
MERRATWLWAAAAAVVCAAIYLEFVADFRTPRSSLAMRGALVTHNKLPPESLAAVTAALKAKFGAAAEVWQGPTGINAKLDGKIVATEPAHTFFHEALGITQVADESGAISTFPFHVSPHELRDSIHPALVPALMMRVAPVFPAGSVHFDLSDFSIEHCRMVPAREVGLGFAGRILGLGNSTICTVVWKRAPSRRMLAGIVVADGGRWIRPFVRRACRMLSNAWLASARLVNPEQPPDYLQCLLIDQPENQPFGSGVSTFAYEVRRDGSLAQFQSRPRAIEEAPLAPDPRIPTFQQRIESRASQR